MPRTSKLPRPASRLARVATALAVASATVIAGVIAAPAAHAAATTVVSDSFSRTGSGWGSAQTGGAYSAGTTPAGVLSTTGSAGRISLARNQFAYVGTAARADDTRVALNARLTAKTGPSFWALLARRQSDKSSYWAQLELTAAGTPTLAISRKNGSTLTKLASKKLSGVSLSSTQRLEVSVTGDNPVRVEVRLATPGSTAAPQLVFSDTSSKRITAAGTTGVWGYSDTSATGKTVLEVDDLTVQNGAAAISASTGSPTPTPAPSPSPAPAPAPSAPSAGARGAATVGTASYAVPAGAIIVGAASSSAASADAASATTYRTVQSAVNAAKAGSTIVIRGGTYNEEVTVPHGKNLTIQNYPGEAVWFDGSVAVSNWSASGSTWVSSGWTTQFSSNMNNQNSRFVQASAPMAASPDQVFVDGVAQRQVASASQVTAGTFAVDYSGKRLILGTNPSGRSVRASNLSQAFNVAASDTTLRGFGVRRYGTTFSDGGAVKFQNVRSTIENVAVTDNAMIGLTLGNNDSVVNRVSSTRNGMLGIGTNASYNLVIKNSAVNGNNVEKFKDAPIAGGIKITRARGVTIDNVDASGNTGAGIWFDESCYDMKVLRSISNDNTTTGIQMEISDKALLVGNQTLGGGTGVMVYNTSNVRILSSDFGQGTYNGISLKQDERRPSTAGTGQDPRMAGLAAASTMTWVTKNITISNNVFGSPGDNSIRAIDGSTNRAVDTWNVTITGNLFNNKAAGGPDMVAWGKGDNRSFEMYQTPAALAAAKNSGWNNAMVSSAKSVAQMRGDAASNAGIAVPLASDVAGLMGVDTGTKKLGSWF